LASETVATALCLPPFLLVTKEVSLSFTILPAPPQPLGTPVSLRGPCFPFFQRWWLPINATATFEPFFFPAEIWMDGWAPSPFFPSLVKMKHVVHFFLLFQSIFFFSLFRNEQPKNQHLLTFFPPDPLSISRFQQPVPFPLPTDPLSFPPFQLGRIKAARQSPFGVFLFFFGKVTGQGAPFCPPPFFFILCFFSLLLDLSICLNLYLPLPLVDWTGVPAFDVSFLFGF